MNQRDYDSEALLQALLAEYPKLLPGSQIDSDSPRRWLLVTREMSVPGEEEGAGRWSLDHLFLDQDAIPTLVEVKRSGDTRLRREVVGQMLDYAANAVVYWPVEEIRDKFEARCDAAGADPDEELATLLGDERDADEFWPRVKTNLQAGRIRLVFVADEIPAELRRVVEFLNSQMDPAEVLAVEIRQYVGEGMKTLVPRVLGQTEQSRQKKSSSGGRREAITEQEFLSEFDALRSPEEQRAARRLIERARQAGLRMDFGRGQRGSSFIPGVEHGGGRYYPISLQVRGMVVLQMRWLKDRSPFNEPAKREALLQRIEGIPGLRTTEAGMEGFPKLPISTLADETVMKTFTGALDWMIGEIRQSRPAQ